MSSSREQRIVKRSDFAQKLLNDLRLRKEHLAASQSSNNANCTAADKYAYSGRSFKGSKEIKARNTGFLSGNTQSRLSGGKTLLTSGEVPNQIVPFGRSQSSEKIDLSTALAFALENAGKATRTDPSGSASIINFLHQIGRRSMDYGKMERRNSIQINQASSSNLPMIHVHIKEISKGAQKLNQIIKACSNGLSFGRYSIEYGKELMQGAIDLEQSLRMLVEIQEASEYMIKPKRKSRIKLLDGDEDDDDDDDDEEDTVKRNEQKQLELPRFSFDKPSRNYQDIQEYARADIKMRLAALTYPAETKISSGKQTPATSTACSHRRSISYSSDVNSFSRFPEQNNQSSSSKPKAEKGRIPNVIAKLMGLKELPEDEDSKYHKQKDSSLNTKIEEAVSSKTVASGTKKTEHKIKDSDLASQNINQKVTQANKVAALENIVALQAGKDSASKNIAMDMENHDETQTQSWKDLKNKTRSQKAIWEQERERDRVNHRNGKDPEKGETKELRFKDELQKMTPYMHRRHKVTAEFQEETDNKASSPLTENNHTNKLPLRSQQKPQNNLGFEQRLLLQKSKPQETKHQIEEGKHNSEKEKLQLGKQKGNTPIPNRLPKALNSIDMKKKQSRINKSTAKRKSSLEVNDVIQTKRSPESTNQKRKSNDRSYGYDPNYKFSNNIPSSKDREPELATVDYPPGTKEKLVLMQATQKAQEGKAHISKIPQKINEVMIRQNGSLCNLTKPLKHQSSSLQEVKDGRQERFPSSKETNLMGTAKSKEAEVYTTKSENSVSNIQLSNVNVAQAQREVKEDPLLRIPEENESQCLRELQTPALANMCQARVLMLCSVKPGSVSDRDEVRKSCEVVPRTLNGTKEGVTDARFTSLKQQKLPEPEVLESLSESENHLKKILVKSQLFLDTAEALFKLNIPFGILRAGGHDYSQEDSNLSLDCGYEIMKRRGRRQELSIHPFVKEPISSTKIKSLDDLVKQLNKEIKKLKSFGRDGCTESLVEDYLPKMLERDVHYIDPDFNCMWDMGWNDLMLAFIEKDDVIRDVERNVLNGLIDEITRDLICA